MNLFTSFFHNYGVDLVSCSDPWEDKSGQGTGSYCNFTHKGFVINLLSTVCLDQGSSLIKGLVQSEVRQECNRTKQCSRSVWPLSLSSSLVAACPAHGSLLAAPWSM